MAETDFKELRRRQKLKARVTHHICQYCERKILKRDSIKIETPMIHYKYGKPTVLQVGFYLCSNCEDLCEVV